MEVDGPAGTLYEAAGAALLAFLFYLFIRAVAGAIPGILGPAGLPLVTISLVLILHFLSAGRGAALSAVSPSRTGGSPESIFWAAGSPVGLALLLLLLLLDLYVRASLSGGHDN